MTDFAVLLTTFPADRDPVPLAKALVAEHLAACVNVLPPMTSIYRWDGAVETADERQLIVKTTRERIEAVTRRLTELHPYDVPEILVVTDVSAGAAYGRWLAESTRIPG